MNQADLRAFEGLCIQEEPPACQTTCPLHVETRDFLRLMTAGKPQEARKVLERTMPLAGIIGRLCDGPCRAACVRSSVDEAVQVPCVERACIAASSPVKPFPLPARGTSVAVVGSGLSALVTAWELGKKGHGVTIFHAAPLGAGLNALPPGVLPPEALEDARAQLEAVRVAFVAVPPPCTVELVEAWLNEHKAVYLGRDDDTFFPTNSPLPPQWEPQNPLTLETEHPSIFSGGTAQSPVLRAAEGKRAAGSVDRLLQGVAPGTARDKEDVSPSRLYTNTAGVPRKGSVPPVAPLAPTVAEGTEEAARCIQCECLECVKVCPYLEHYKGYPKKYAREFYNNLSVVQGLRQANRAVNSCAECGLCAAVCPTHADMGAFCAAARHEMVAANRMPPSAHEFALEDMAFSNSADVAFARHQPGHDSSAYLFFPGCQLPASLPRHTEAVYRRLCSTLDGGTGFLFGCCGAPAQWSGRPVLTAAVAEKLAVVWRDMGKPEVIVACASCLRFLQTELPDVPCRSLWDVLGADPPPDAAGTDETLALHDPCPTREEERTQANVRAVLRRIGQKFEELPLGRSLTRCCGYGGLADAANPAVGRRFAEVRAGDTEHPLLSYCIMCRDRLRAAGKPGLHLLELLFPLDENRQKAVERPAPGISARQSGRREFRDGILLSLWGEEAAPRPAGFDLHIPDALAALMEERRIRIEDVEDVLRHAKEHGALFRHPQSGKKLAALRDRQATFWVEYTERRDSGFAVHNVYSHRMVVPGVPGAGKNSPCTLEGYAAKGGRM